MAPPARRRGGRRGGAGESKAEAGVRQARKKLAAMKKEDAKQSRSRPTKPQPEPKPEPEPEPQPNPGPASLLPSGSIVMVRGLIGAPQHNGKAATLIEFLTGKGRYDVQLPDGNHLLLRPINVSLHPDHQPEPVSTAQDGATKTPQPTSQPEDAKLPVGCAVRVQGLAGAPQHNGKRGSVVKYLAAKGRYEIRLDGEAIHLSLRPANVCRVSTPERESEPAVPSSEPEPEPEAVLESESEVELELGPELEPEPKTEQPPPDVAASAARVDRLRHLDVHPFLSYYAGQPETSLVTFYSRRRAWEPESEPQAGHSDNSEADSNTGWDSHFATTWDSYLKETRTRFGARLHKRSEDDRQFEVNERLAMKLAMRDVEARLGEQAGDEAALILELDGMDLPARRARAIAAGATEQELEAADGAEDPAAAMLALVVAHEVENRRLNASLGPGGGVSGETGPNAAAEAAVTLNPGLVGEVLARRTAERDREVVEIRNRLMARAEADRALAKHMRNAALFAKGNSKSLPANFVHKKKEADNKRARANVHHGNAHYNFSGSKQFQKGVRVKGIVQRKAKGGGKQAAAAKAAKGKKSESGKGD